MHSPYAGRWVARIRGAIVAQGSTPEEALRASQGTRHKEKPEIVYMSLLPPLLEKIKLALDPAQEIYLVGGAVRDLLLSRISPDFDFAVPANGIALARKIANSLDADFMPLDEERDTGRVIITNEDGSHTYLDFATYRGADFQADLHGRDFTINAIALDLKTEAIIDPLEGGKDLRLKIIRACSPTSLSDDPVRILRAVRMASAFGLTIDKETRGLMKQAASGLVNISAERLRDEIFKMLNGPKPEACIRALEMLGTFPYLMSELSAMKGVTQSPPHVYDVWSHTLAAIGHLDGIISSLRVGYQGEETNDMFTGLLALRIGRYREQFAAFFNSKLNPDRSMRSLLFFAALFHDVSKPATKTIDPDGRIRFFDHDIQGAEIAAERGRKFGLSNDEVERIRNIIKNHMRIHSFVSRYESEGQLPSRKAVYRFFRDGNGAGIELILLALADMRGTRAHELNQKSWENYLDVSRLLLESYWEKPQEVVSPPRLLDGNDLMKELSLKPGRQVGELLEAIRENQAAGIIETREQALAFAREEMTKHS